MGNAIGIAADLTEPRTPERIVAAAIEAFGQLDIVVGSTGGPTPGTALDTTADAYDGALDLLVKPMVRLSHLALPHMRERGWGRIVFVTSTVVREPAPMLVLSNSVRMAVHGFAKSLARQVAGDGITVNSVMPGRIATDRVASLDQAAAKASGRPIEDIQARRTTVDPRGTLRRTGRVRGGRRVPVLAAGGLRDRRIAAGRRRSVVESLVTGLAGSKARSTDP